MTCNHKACNNPKETLILKQGTIVPQIFIVHEIRLLFCKKHLTEMLKELEAELK